MVPAVVSRGRRGRRTVRQEPRLARRLGATAHVSWFSSHFAVVDVQQRQLFMLLALCLAALLELATPQLQPPSIA